MLATSAGCAIPAIIGGMARSAQETGSTVFPAEYDGLRDETWAVVCFADRGITSEVFNVQTIVTNATTGKLVQAQVEGTLGSAGFQQGQNVLLLQTAEPAFDAWTYGKMAEELGVSRLVIVDIDHFQLYEPGNQYVWNGRVTARVGVVEADGMADSFAFSRDIDIIYPDGKGYTSTDFSRGHVVNVLLERLTNRVAWLFFEHEEPNAIEY
jgi:hypothetical protein